MNLRSRIKKLEQKINTSISDYCLCYGQEKLKYEFVPITIDEWNCRFLSGGETDERLPDVCEQCRKPVDKRHIEITFEQHKQTQEKRLNETMKLAMQRRGLPYQNYEPKAQN